MGTPSGGTGPCQWPKAGHYQLYAKLVLRFLPVYVAKGHLLAHMPALVLTHELLSSSGKMQAEKPEGVLLPTQTLITASLPDHPCRTSKPVCFPHPQHGTCLGERLSGDSAEASLAEVRKESLKHYLTVEDSLPISLRSSESCLGTWCNSNHQR